MDGDRAGRRPAPPATGWRLAAAHGLPTLRAFQLGQGMVALDWLRRRTGWT